MSVQGADGNAYNVTPQELMQLAQHGLNKLTVKDESEPVKDEPEPDDTSRIQGLEDKIKTMEQTFVIREQEAQYNHIMNQTVAKFDITKDNEKLSKLLKINALAQVQQNPRLNLAEVLTNNVKDMMDMMNNISEENKKKIESNLKVERSLSGLVRGGGGLPNIDRSKPLTAKELKNGTSRKLLTTMLARALEGD